MSGSVATPTAVWRAALVRRNTPVALLGADTRDPAAIPHWDGQAARQVHQPRVCFPRRRSRKDDAIPRGAVLLIATVLGGCSMMPREVVKVPVAVPCISTVPARPNLVTDAELRVMTDYQVPLALFRDREQRHVYEARLEAIIGACVALSPLESP